MILPSFYPQAIFADHKRLFVNAKIGLDEIAVRCGAKLLSKIYAHVGERSTPLIGALTVDSCGKAVADKISELQKITNTDSSSSNHFLGLCIYPNTT